MNPLTFEQLLTLISVLVAATTLILTARRDTKTEREAREAAAVERQRLTDKLDSISDMSRETRDTVREMSRQLNDHSKQLARIEEQIKEHDDRLDKIEGKVGLTD